jgi:hypothetical protein
MTMILCLESGSELSSVTIPVAPIIDNCLPELPVLPVLPEGPEGPVRPNPVAIISDIYN